MSLSNLFSSAFWVLCKLLPVHKNRIVFCSFYGRGYSDSPKAIADALLQSNSELLWLVSTPEEAASLPAGIRPVPYRGWRRILALSTAKVWVDNCRKYDRYKKKNQLYLQTWHGFALKKIEADAASTLDDVYVRACKLDSSHCDLIVSGSRFMTDLYHRSFWYDGPVENFGTPRNDCFFSDCSAVHSAVLQKLGLPDTQRLVLYAPTFRADGSLTHYSLDAPQLLRACAARFGGSWSCLIRLHPNIAHQSKELFPYDGTTILDATAYPDMAELLIAADVLITDYSSSMFDFALSGKPCFQFATDIADYRQDRSFNFPLDALPFALAEDNAQLCAAIQGYDPETAHEKWNQFALENGICEDGHASQRCAQWILDHM